jgi:hypothetical protein
MHSLDIISSHHPKAIYPETSNWGVSGFDRDIKNEPPGGKINFPLSVSTIVISGSPLRTNDMVPPANSPCVMDAYCNCILFWRGGWIAVFAIETNGDATGVPEGDALNQN